MGDRDEVARIRRVYEAYAANPRCESIWARGPAFAFMHGRKWDILTAWIRDLEIDLTRARILDAGGGGGSEDAARFIALGAAPRSIVAVDLRMDALRRSAEQVAAVNAHAGRLPFRDGTFNLVYQSTMLSSVLDRHHRNRIVAELGRVLAPGGAFVSYDVRYPNPWNRHTRCLGGREIARRFRGWRLRLRSLTALPPLLRFLSRWYPGGCGIAESIPPLRSHLLALAQKPPAR